MQVTRAVTDGVLQTGAATPVLHVVRRDRGERPSGAPRRRTPPPCPPARRTGRGLQIEVPVEVLDTVGSPTAPGARRPWVHTSRRPRLAADCAIPPSPSDRASCIAGPPGAAGPPRGTTSLGLRDVIPCRHGHVDRDHAVPVDRRGWRTSSTRARPRVEAPDSPAGATTSSGSELLVDSTRRPSWRAHAPARCRAASGHRPGVRRTARPAVEVRRPRRGAAPPSPVTAPPGGSRQAASSARCSGRAESTSAGT